MECIHPFCPMGRGAESWKTALDDERLAIGGADRQTLAAYLKEHCSVAPGAVPVRNPWPASAHGALRRLLGKAPCLYAQIDTPLIASAVPHFCELTLGEPITSKTAHDAFLIQHPNKGPPYKFPPNYACRAGGSVMEMLCSEILANAGIPAMPVDDSGWPVWNMPGHILMNTGKMNEMRAFGDILIPCAPTNIVISVKSEAARERLLYSSNAIEGIGFGFFNEPREFWSVGRMRLYKRMGFSAIYLPQDTFDKIINHVTIKNHQSHNVNVNGTPLYRPLCQFEGDIHRIIGKSSLHL